MKYGKLTFIELSGKTKDGHFLWKTICDCGSKYICQGSRVRTGKNTQCRLCANKQISESRKTHGMKYSPEYSSWISMKDRCLNKNSKDYYRYGAKGINVYEPWIHSFEEFFAYMGKKNKGDSIDRIDNEKGYEPNNVRWANSSTQARNKKKSIWVLWKNKNTHISDVAKDLGITRGAAIMRYKRNKLYV